MWADRLNRKMLIIGTDAMIATATLALALALLRPVAPAAAAAVYANLSIVAVFFIDIVTAAIGIGLLSRIAVPRLVHHEVSDGAHAGYFDDLVGGLRYAAHEHALG